MGRNIFWGLVGVILSSIVVLFMFQSFFNTVYDGVDAFTGASFSSMSFIGFIEALMYTLLFTDMGYSMLVIWIVIGITLGLLARGSMNGFVTGFFVPIVAFVIYYIGLMVNGYFLFITIALDMKTLFSELIVPILSIGFLVGFGGLIGGHFRPVPDVEVSKEVLQRLEKLIPRKCPNCGAVIHSSALYCSECGTELPELIFSVKRN